MRTLNRLPLRLKPFSALREGSTDVYASGTVHAVLNSFPCLIASGLDAERDKVQIMPVPGAGKTGVSFGVAAAKALEAGKYQKSRFELTPIRAPISSMRVSCCILNYYQLRPGLRQRLHPAHGASLVLLTIFA
jgi:hypothetical protein